MAMVTIQSSVSSLRSPVTSHQPPVTSLQKVVLGHRPGLGLPTNGTLQIALRDIAEGTGLSKRAVQAALSWLVKRKLVAVARASITAVPVYTVLRPWRRA